MPLRVALVHDYLTQRGGAERVARVMTDAFPGAELLTSAYRADTTFPEFRSVPVRTSFVDRVPLLRRDPRLALPLLPRAFDSLDPGDVDVVLCSTTGFAHGVRTEAPKVVYCHNPPRWLYQPDDYLAGQPAAARLALRGLRGRLLRWDQAAARSAHLYLVNSTTVQARVRAAYGIEATVLAPPVAVRPDAEQDPAPDLEPGFFLAVSRARGYKNVAVTCRAFAAMPDQRLVVVGGLPAGEDWPANLTGVRDVSDARLRWLYANCQGLVAAAHEDFGLTPVEANAFGKPAVVLRAGGFLDTLVEGTTGVFIEALTPAAVREAVQRCLASSFDPDAVRAHADRYSEASFVARLRAVVADAATTG